MSNISLPLHPFYNKIQSVRGQSIPVMMMAEMELSASKSRTALPSSTNRGLHSAFRALGRFSWIMPTFFLAPATSILMFSYAGAVKNSFLIVFPDFCSLFVLRLLLCHFLNYIDRI